MTELTGGFGKLHDNIVNTASKTLEHIAPEQVKAFWQASQQANVSEALDALANIEGHHEFNKWRDICVDLIDVRLQMHRVKISLVLLNSVTVPSLSHGEWTEYHFNAWAFLMQGLLCRVEKLAKAVVRKLVRPTNADWKSIESEILEMICNLKERVGKIRHPIAHTGGAVEALANQHGIERYVLIGGHPNVRDLLGPMANYQRRWFEILSNVSIYVLAEIDKLSERLDSQVKWKSNS